MAKSYRPIEGQGIGFHRDAALSKVPHHHPPVASLIHIGGDSEKNQVCKYCTRAIISRGLYTFLPHFQRPFMYCDLWPYVWLVFKSGF